MTGFWRRFAVVSVVAVAGAAACAQPAEVMHVRSIPPAPMATELPAPSDDDGWPPDLGPLGNATVTVPGWGAGVTACHTGRVQIKDGVVAPGPVTQLWIESSVVADVDRDGADDYTAILRCGEGPEAPGWQVVAFRRTAGEFTPIGRVIGSQDGLPMLSGLELRDGGRIAVNLGKEYVDSGAQFTPHQWRVYAFEGGRFRQVDGPTSFADDPPAAALGVDPADLVFHAAQGAVVTAELQVTVRNTGDAGVSGVRLTIRLPVEVRPAGSGWTGCTRAVRAGEPVAVMVCPVGPLAARSFWVTWLQVVTDAQPWIAPTEDGSGYRPDTSSLEVRQVPPYTFESPVNSESDIRITRA